MEEKYTKKQGQYLSFIYYYMKLNRRAPAQFDIQQYFGTNPANVNQMLKTLERKQLIERIPGKARSIKLLLSKDEIPELE